MATRPLLSRVVLKNPFLSDLWTTPMDDRVSYFTITSLVCQALAFAFDDVGNGLVRYVVGFNVSLTYQGASRFGPWSVSPVRLVPPA